MTTHQSSIQNTMAAEGNLVLSRFRIHDLKCWPIPFGLTRDGLKPFEIRLNDRDFKTGDVILLREWVPETGLYTGHQLYLQIGHIEYLSYWGLSPDHVVMAVTIIDNVQ